MDLHACASSSCLEVYNLLASGHSEGREEVQKGVEEGEGWKGWTMFWFWMRGKGVLIIGLI